MSSWRFMFYFQELLSVKPMNRGIPQMQQSLFFLYVYQRINLTSNSRRVLFVWRKDIQEYNDPSKKLVQQTKQGTTHKQSLTISTILN